MSKMHVPVVETVFSPDQYAKAFHHLHTRKLISELQYRFLRAHLDAPERTATATQLAEACGHASYRVTNRWYGQLGRDVSETLAGRLGNPWLETLVNFNKPDGEREWQLTLRPEVVEALAQLDLPL